VVSNVYEENNTANNSVSVNMNSRTCGLQQGVN